jgi:hypothetical protein
VGITSFNIGFADDVFPNMEVRISAMSDFIQRGICNPPDYCHNAVTKTIDTVVTCRGLHRRLPLKQRKQAAAAFEMAYNAVCTSHVERDSQSSHCAPSRVATHTYSD